MEKTIKIGDAIYPVTSDDNYLDVMGKNFEPHMVQLFRALIGPNDVVADIGANIGLTALLFSSLAKKTYAFEPSPSTYSILSENLTRNNIANVEAVNLGLGQNQEALTITFAKNNRSGGYISNKIRPETGHVTEDIHIDTLDQFFAGKEPTPTFLKIDVEGFEQNVIQGARGFLQSARPTVVMEMNHFCLDVLQRITIPDFLDFMRSVFPCLYAVDTDNASIVDLHVSDQAYMVMHEHVVKHRFPNLVGGFDRTIKQRLDALARTASLAYSFKTPVLSQPTGTLISLVEPKQIKVGGKIEIPVRVMNQSQEEWHGYGDNPVLLSYHWKNLDGSYHTYDGIRTELDSAQISPNESLEQHLSVLAPSDKGCFQLELTSVQEGVCWFEDRGFDFVVLNVEII